VQRLIARLICRLRGHELKPLSAAKDRCLRIMPSRKCRRCRRWVRV